MRLANIGVEKGDEVSVFMLGKGVTFEQVDSQEFDVKGQMDQFEGDFYVWGVCMKSHGMGESSSCPIGWMDDLYEIAKEADKVLTFWFLHVVRLNEKIKVFRRGMGVIPK